VVLAVKAAASLVALAVGFRAVSDDDFARVVLAQAWAHAPRLDPTGSSWLPAPFWLYGAVFRLAGPTLGAARAVAFALGLLSAVVVLVAARWITGDRRAALAGALVAAVFPWSARLGVAAIPELPTAALTLLAIASLGTPSPDRRLWAAGGLALATLSRYEPWPIAAAFAAWSLLGALRLGQPRAAQAKLALAALIALAGPAAWVAWNHAVHGEALHFLARVAAYRQALRPQGDGTLLRLFAYPAAMFREEPEIVLSPLALWLVTRRAQRRPASSLAAAAPALAAAARPYLLPAALAASQIAALSIALVRDGAPTHHPERATLVALLVVALAVGDLGDRALRAAGAADRKALGAAAAVVALLGLLLIRPFLRRETFNARADEVAVGRAAAALVPAGEPVLIEVADYGYFAVLAAFGRPGDAVLDRSIDPRDPPAASSFDDGAALRRRAAEAGAAYFVARPAPAVEALAGPPLATSGGWALWMRPGATPRHPTQEPSP
jgi:hypothetical protein